MLKKPRLSVIVPVFNGRKFLRHTVLSILAATFGPTEILILDDGSTDGSVENVSDLPVKIIREPINRGISETRNRGIRLARADFITFVDQDDVVTPESFRWRWNWLRANSDREVVGGSVGKVIDENGRDIPEVTRLYRNTFSRAPAELTLDYFRAGGRFAGAVWLFMYRRRIFHKIGPYDPKLAITQDWDYLYRILNHAPIPYFDKPVVDYRLHETNVSVRRVGSRHEPYRRAIAEIHLVNLSHGIRPGAWDG